LAHSTEVRTCDHDRLAICGTGYEVSERDGQTSSGKCCFNRLEGIGRQSGSAWLWRLPQQQSWLAGRKRRVRDGARRRAPACEATWMCAALRNVDRRSRSAGGGKSRFTSQGKDRIE